MMYRIVKVLNHNAFIGIRDRDKCKCLVMAKGIAFGKKTGENVSAGEDADRKSTRLNSSHLA